MISVGTVTDAVSISPSAPDQQPESMPNDRANVSRPREINGTKASWRRIGGDSRSAGSRTARQDLIAVLMRLEGAGAIERRKEGKAR